MHVKQFFLRNGFVPTESAELADYIVFFACGLTEPKEKQSISMLKKLQDQKKDNAQIILWGCLPKISFKHLKEVYAGPIIGPKDLWYFEKLLNKNLPINEVNAINIVPKNTLDVPEFSEEPPYDPIIDALSRFKRQVDRVRLPQRKWLFDASSCYVRVSEGCNGKCTYCSERPAWGGVKSKSVEKVVEDFKRGIDRGYKRFFLVSGDLGSYGIDTGENLGILLERILSAGEGRDFKLIMNQMNPVDLSRLLPSLEKIFASGKIEALGCQVESGSNRILSLMGREYTAKSWRDAMLKINKRFPFVRLSTHFMIGFPGETEEDFEETVKLLDFPLFIDWVGFFLFSARPTVYASKLPSQISEKVKHARFVKVYRKYLFMYALNVILGNIRYLRSKI